jgi:N-acetylglucosaminyl-diphospho-decaprenol L-rhamnosyltransferase
VTAPAPAAGGPVELDVVIVSFEARDCLLRALAALAANAGIAHQPVVVDNASGDGSVEAVRAACPGARVIAHDRNAGFSVACNQGWRSGTAPLVLFLNPDAEVHAGAIPALARKLRERPDVGVVGPRTRNADGRVQVSTGPDLGLRSERAQRRLVRGVARRDPRALAEAERRHSREHEPDWVSGSCLMIRRECLEAVGGFDEGFFLYEEDADLCRRVRAAGWRVLFAPEAEVVHQLGRSMAQAARRARFEYHRSHLRYYRKHSGRAALLALRALLLARGAAAFLSGLARGDAAGRSEAADLVRLAVASGPPQA